MPVFFLLTSTLLTVALLGGGIFPFTIGAIAAILSSACIIVFSRQQSTGSATLPLLSAALVLMITATVIPLPSAFISCVSPTRASQHAVAEQAIREAAALGIAGTNTSAPLSALTQNRAGTARMILLIIAGFSIAALSAGLTETWRGRYLRFLVLFTVLIAAAGVVSQWIYPQGKNIWWLFPVPHGMPVGCFINRNHFGGFSAMMCSPAIFLAADRFANKRRLPALFWIICFAILSSATILSLSKGAWLALSVSMTFTFLVLLLRRQFALALVLPVLLIIAFSVTTTRCPQLRERFVNLPGLLQSQSAEMRLSTWKDSLAILRDNPFTGTGANAFRMVFPQYRSATTRKPYDHAENEYVQIPVEFGLPATAIVIAIMFFISIRWKVMLLADKNPTIPLCIAGLLVTVAAHSFTDYALRIPLYFLTVTSMLGLVLPTIQDKPQCAGKHSPLAMILSAGMLLISTAVSCMGERIYRLDSTDYLKNAPVGEICRALSWSPVSWQAWYRLGTEAIKTGSDKACRFGEKCITQAAVCDPNNSDLWMQLAKLRLSIQDLEGALEANRRMKELRAWKQIKELEGLQHTR